MDHRGRILSSIVFVISAAGWFILSTIVHGQAPHAAFAFLAALAAFATALVVFGVPRASDVRQLGRKNAGLALAGGVLVTLAVPVLSFAARLTDAPSGSETLFFTTGVWAVVGVIAAIAICRDQPSLTQLGFALVALVGVAALVANWERPSSFSPFVKFPERELVMTMGGFAWAFGTVLIARTMKARIVGRAVPGVASGFGALVTLGWLLADGGLAGLRQAIAYGPVTLILAVTYAVMLWSWMRALQRSSLGPASALWLFVPLVVVGLGAIEQATQPFGPDPVVWGGAFAAIVLIVVGAVGVMVFSRYDSDDAVIVPRSVTVLSAGLAGIGLLCGTCALVLPAFAATVQGTLANGRAYRVEWSMLGLESAAGWLPPLAALLLLTASYSALREWGARRVVWVSVAALAVLAMYSSLVNTPLRTWNRWIPAEVQQEYGTEYARLAMVAINEPVRTAAVILAALAAILLLVGAVFAFYRERALHHSPASKRVEDYA